MDERSSPPSRALVLAGGGIAGISWLLGLVDGLARRGVDLAGADSIIGTSAGACVGAQLATGALARAIELQRRTESAEVQVAFDLDAYVATLSGVADAAADPREARVRIANLPPLGRTISEAARRDVIAARLPEKEWPDRELLVTAVDAASGELVTFDRRSGVDLVDAVTASCALPGVWPAATIRGRRYVDGGVRSPTNADLARGHEAVTILIPTPINAEFRRRLDAESEALGSASVHVIAADDASLAAIGPNPLDPSRRRAALDAGAAQARRVPLELSRVP